jgi:hypothetical protein
LSRACAGKSKRLSDSNPLAPLATTRADDLAAALGTHASPEPVGLFALAVVRLKSPLHGFSSPNIGRVTLSQRMMTVKPEAITGLPQISQRIAVSAPAMITDEAPRREIC